MNDLDSIQLPSALPSNNPEITVGNQLKSARIAIGLEIAELAHIVKIPAGKITLIESQQFDDLPDVVFLRAMVSSLCRALKLDSAPLLAQIPLSHEKTKVALDRGLGTPFGSARSTPVWLMPSLYRVYYLWAAFGFVVLAAVFYFYPEIKESWAQSHFLSSKNTDVVQKVLPPNAPLLVEKVAAVSKGAAETVDVTVPAVVSSQPAPVFKDLLTLQARGLSWVEVTDAKGVVILQKTLQSGDVIPASGIQPLSVIVGRADLTDVWVRGQPFDIKRIAIDNVARFQVK